MHSCLYQGYVQHRRVSPAEHVFRYGLYLAYLDLDELPALLAGGHGLTRARFAPASFCRGDHLGDPRTALPDAVRDLVESRTSRRPAGPIRLLTLLRNWGYYFCPLGLYYCFDPHGEHVDAVVAEVSNTPWREQHCYVLSKDNRIGEPPELRFQHPKEFHVSPFMDMKMRYQWHLQAPGEHLGVGIASSRGDERMFDVSMVLQRRELSRAAMLRTLVRHPWMAGRVIQAIYWQAFRLWRTKCPFHTHPNHREQSEARPL